MKFIVNADDLGRTETVNQAIFESFENRYITNATIMVNMPFFDEAKEQAFNSKLADKIGLHINLTSGIPLTKNILKCRHFVDKNGRFNSEIFRNKRIQFIISPFERKAVKEEVCAQIEKFIASGFSLKHADSHGHIHTFFSLQGIFIKTLKQYGFNSVRISRNLNVVGSKFKILTKKVINKRFTRYFKTTKFFGSYYDIKTEINNISANNFVEIMLHPNYLDGKCYFGEEINKEELLAFLNNNYAYYSQL